MNGSNVLFVRVPNHKNGIVKVMVCTPETHYWVRPTKEGLRVLRERESSGEVRLHYLREREVCDWEQRNGRKWTKR